MSARLGEFAAQPLTPEARGARRAWVSERYDWHDIARRTLAVYEAVASGVEPGR